MRLALLSTPIIARTIQFIRPGRSKSPRRRPNQSTCIWYAFNVSPNCFMAHNPLLAGARERHSAAVGVGAHVRPPRLRRRAAGAEVCRDRLRRQLLRRPVRARVLPERVTEEASACSVHPAFRRLVVSSCPLAMTVVMIVADGARDGIAWWCLWLR